MNANEVAEASSMSRRSALKLFTGTILAGMAGVGSSVAKTFIGETPLTAATLPTLFNVQGMTAPQGLIFNLVYREPHEPEYFRPIRAEGDKPLSIYGEKDGIPEMVIQFEKQAIDCEKMTEGDITNSVKQFIDHAIENLPYGPKWGKKYGSGGRKTDFVSNLVIESNRIAVKCRRGSANRVLLHPQHKDLVGTIPREQRWRWEFIYTEDMPKGKMILWYNGPEFYDGAITVAFAADADGVDGIERKKLFTRPHDKANKYMLCFHDNCLAKYCTVVTL